MWAKTFLALTTVVAGFCASHSGRRRRVFAPGIDSNLAMIRRGTPLARLVSSPESIHRSVAVDFSPGEVVGDRVKIHATLSAAEQPFYARSRPRPDELLRCPPTRLENG